MSNFLYDADTFWVVNNKLKFIVVILSIIYFLSRMFLVAFLTIEMPGPFPGKMILPTIRCASSHVIQNDLVAQSRIL